MSVRNLYPQQRPTLNLNFAQSKILDPRITFTRTSTATYVDEDGFIKTVNSDVARFDHDPVSGECLGLLIEGQRENLINYSNYFSSGSSPRWSNIFPATATITTGIDAPDGTNTAVRLSCNNTGNSLLRIEFTPFTPNGTDTYTVSFYVRKISGTTANPSNQLTCDLNDGSPSTDYLPQLIDNRWVRVIASGVPTNASKSFFDILSDRTTDYVLDFWGVQLERGEFVTSLIPTEGSTKIRTPDNAYIEGTQFNQFYNLSEGTVFCSFSSPTPYGRTNATPFVFSINRNTIGWGHYVSSGGSSISLFRDPSDVNIAFLNTDGSPTIGITDQERKLSVGYKLDDFVQYVNIGNGVISERTDSLGQVRTDINAFAFNPQHSGLQRFGGHIQKFVYYPTKFTNTQIRNLAL